MSKNNFLKGAAILGIAGVIVKILGAFYRIPLSNIIKTEGMGYYQTAYPLYVLLLTLSTAGFPVAIAKLVSEKRALGDYKGAHKVFKVALSGLFLAGLVTSLFVFINAKSIVKTLGNEKAYYSLIALVPALFFVPIMAAFRGFFQGRQVMTPTALSQIVEQFFRVTAGLVLTYILLDRGTHIAAGGASFGGSMGAMAGAVVIIFIYLSKKSEIRKEIETGLILEEESAGKIIRDILSIAIPITIGSAIVPIMNTIDTLLVFKRLQSIGFSAGEANELYGQLTGLAQTLINLPQVFSTALAISLVPAISEANVKKRFDEIRGISISGIRVTLLIGLPCAFGLFVLSRPIINLLYFKNTPESIASTGEILSILSFSVIFLTLVQSLTAILQGLGKPLISVKNLLIGAVGKVVLTFVLTGIEGINIKGAAISTVTAYFIAAGLDLISVKKYTRLKLNIKELFIKPLVSSLGMALVARVSYLALLGIIGDRLSTVIAIFLGVISYGVLLLVTGSLTYEDFNLLPKGDRIGNLLLKLKLIKR
ncbi:putative polysaccharide biosynthesis protein [Tepidimicrobium xylanilyticum]|uniref:Stage V sporulation protein B n=1 Tax=Tepidimicrobium xylanilyticum TaxID=1123352 RepID=A0A1H2XQT2_9FIRM|nr:polysaccharide biosynthesis protein [Tepidimicrobium xylanilyticum]GMG97562.1 stage V sporulation protein B [Tepidimicrobium xylanilyticum]SDW95058.1 stage V sporulation protein B [Tepidimicrobium xylanilyticum]